MINELISIQLNKDYIVVETLKGTRTIPISIVGGDIEVLQALGLRLYELPKKIQKHGPKAQ